MHEYYNPALSDDERRALDWENFVLLECTQALLGIVSSNMRAVSVDAPLNAAVEVYFALAVEDVDDREEITEEFPTELNVLLNDRAAVISHIWIGEDWAANWPGRDKRLVFARK